MGERTTLRVTGVIQIPVAYEITVDADTEGGAWGAARDAAYRRARAEMTDERAGFIDHKVETIRGRLVASVRWYDLHGPGDVVLAEAVTGAVLSKSEADAIAKRLESLGLRVVDRWNVGCEQTSFRCRGRKRKGTATFTAKQRDMLRGNTRVEDLTDNG